MVKILFSIGYISPIEYRNTIGPKERQWDLLKVTWDATKSHRIIQNYIVEYRITLDYAKFYGFITFPCLLLLELQKNFNLEL